MPLLQSTMIPYIRGNELSFPCERAPDVNPYHPAMKAAFNRSQGFIGASFIPKGEDPSSPNASFLELFTNQPLTSVGTGLNLVNTIIGPSISPIDNTSVAVWGTPVAAVEALQFTTAAIFMMPVDNATGSAIISFDGAAAGVGIQVNGTGSFGVAFSGGATSLNVIDAPGTTIFTPGQPYFVVFSANYTTANSAYTFGDTFLGLTNLATGQMYSSFVVSDYLEILDIFIAGSGQGGYPMGAGGSVGPSMVVYGYLTPAQCFAWMADPWTFWYPPGPLENILSAIIPPRSWIGMQGIPSTQTIGLGEAVPPVPVVTRLGSNSHFGTTSNINITCAVSVPIGTLVVAVTTQQFTTEVGQSITDTKGNTYTPAEDTGFAGGNVPDTLFWYSYLTTALTTSDIITYNAPTDGTGETLFLTAASVTNIKGIYDTATANVSGPFFSAGPYTVTSGIPAAPNEIFFGFCTGSGGGTLSNPNSPWNNIITSTPGTLQFGWQVNYSMNPMTFTGPTTSGWWDTAIISFKVS